MKNISFAMTIGQLLDGSKDVTRRLRWIHLKPGDQMCAVKKSMGMKAGEKIERLGICTVVSVRRERLDSITIDDVWREGYPGMSPAAFVAKFTSAMKCHRDDAVTRIEFTFERTDSMGRLP
jgi:hypothetical protein